MCPCPPPPRLLVVSRQLCFPLVHLVKRFSEQREKKCFFLKINLLLLRDIFCPGSRLFLFCNKIITLLVCLLGYPCLSLPHHVPYLFTVSGDTTKWSQLCFPVFTLGWGVTVTWEVMWHWTVKVLNLYVLSQKRHLGCSLSQPPECFLTRSGTEIVWGVVPDRSVDEV